MRSVKPFMLVYESKTGGLCQSDCTPTAKNYKKLLEKMQTIWQKDLPGTPFEYDFLDEEVQKQYETEITLSRIINLFTLMAI